MTQSYNVTAQAHLFVRSLLIRLVTSKCNLPSIRPKDGFTCADQMADTFLELADQVVDGIAETYCVLKDTMHVVRPGRLDESSSAIPCPLEKVASLDWNR